MKKLNKFDLSNEVKLSFKAGNLIPINVLDCLPGDKVRLSTEVFCRVAPMIAPLLHRVNLRVYHYAVPIRLIFDNYEEFFTMGEDFDNAIDMPKIVINESRKSNFGPGELADYMGIAPILDTDTVSGNHYFNALPFRAYQLIYKEHFRNQEVYPADDIEVKTDSADTDGYDAIEFADLTTMRTVNWDNDYFSTCKTDALRNAAVYGVAHLSANDGGSIYEDQSYVYDYQGNTISSLTTIQNYYGDLRVNTGIEGRIENLSADAGISIEDLRQASALQRWIEVAMNVGYRYVDYLKSFWGVKPQDSRLDRPEFIGAHSEPVRISEVLNTSDTANAPQGNMSGHGLALGQSRYFDYECKEHCYILSLMVVTPKPAYSRGIDEHWFKFDNLDWAHPMLANLGLQETPTSGLYYDYEDSQATNRVNFGYKNRYAEYKSRVDRVAGEFRDSLSYWTYHREFTSRPTLNKTFMYCQPKVSVFTVEDEDHYFGQVFNHVSMLRNLPYYSVPKID